jgi:hypothetical protein
MKDMNVWRLVLIAGLALGAFLLAMSYQDIIRYIKMEMM